MSSASASSARQSRALILPGIDQVETGAGKRVRATSKAARASASRVQPAEPLQIGVVQGLNAHRNTIDARRRETPEPSGLDRGRVRLQGDLDIVGTGPARPRGVDDGGHDLAAP
jgi:hypothetical protein